MIERRNRQSVSLPRQNPVDNVARIHPLCVHILGTVATVQGDVGRRIHRPLKNSTAHYFSPQQPAVKRVQPSSRTFGIRRTCCHTSEIRALTANPPNSAQLEGSPYHSPKLHLGLCSVGMQRGTDTHTHTHRVTIRFAWIHLIRNVTTTGQPLWSDSQSLLHYALTDSNYHIWKSSESYSTELTAPSPNQTKRTSNKKLYQMHSCIVYVILLGATTVKHTLCDLKMLLILGYITADNDNLRVPCPSSMIMIKYS